MLFSVIDHINLYNSFNIICELEILNSGLSVQTLLGALQDLETQFLYVNPYVLWVKIRITKHNN